MSHPTLDIIERRLAAFRPRRKLLRRWRKRSAVAMVVMERDGEPHILMIKRAEREGDPWSGHMAFPGGRMDPGDDHGFATAVRETAEEVGLQLVDTDPCLGRLSEIGARPGRGWLGMAVSPFVFLLQREVAFTPNHEVAETHWVPLSFIWDMGNRRTMQWRFRGIDMTLPCYVFRQRTIWGLSLMMLDELMTVVDGPDARRAPWRPR